VSIEIRPQQGPQEAFLATSADIAIYGGAAGGGKSYALLLEPLRHKDNADFGGVIFRRTSPQLVGAGSLWEEASRIYGALSSVELRENPSLTVKYPSGATLQFSHLQFSKDALTHHGKQYAFIGFDELTHFEEFQFWYLVSRLRSLSSITPYMRCTTNPDPDSFVRKLIDWWIDESGFPIPERSGVVRWFVRDGETLIWADNPEDLPELDGFEPLSMTFIHASLEDNPALLKKDPGYRSRLQILPEVERMRLLGGNWDVRPESGRYIKLPWFSKRWTTLPEKLNIYTATDFAVTEAEAGKDPDYTEIGVFGVDADDNLYVLDWWYDQTTSDVWIERLIDIWKERRPLIAFGEGGAIRRAVEPHLRKRMRERRVYRTIEWLNPVGSRGQGASKQGFADKSKQAKAIRGRSFQARAAMEKIIFPEDSYAPWVRRVVDQCVAFPVGKDDAFDVMSQICSGIDKTNPAAREHKQDRKAQRRDYGANEPRKTSWKVA